jgi:methionine synthase / methylenetetrahydrofolate reductase (NADH)
LTTARSQAFLDRVAAGPLLADGAMGTMLYAAGVPLDQCLDAVNGTRPDLVADVHRAYVEAGADLLETNTFGANRFKLATHGLADRTEVLNEAGVRIARMVADAAGRPVFVAGSIGPLGRQLAPLGALTEHEALAAFAEQAKALVAAGADAVILETFVDLRELLVAVRAVRETASVPIIAQMTFAPDGRTLLGYTPEEIVSHLEALRVDVVGANCSVGPHSMIEVVERMVAVTRGPISAMPNAGLPSYVGGRLTYLASHDYMAEHAAMLVDAGVTIVGGCCGTTPQHIESMRAAITGRPRGTAQGPKPSPAPRLPATPRVGADRLETMESAAASPPPAPLAQKLGRRFVISVEVSPPRGANDAEELENCRRLRAVGADAVDIADNPMARLRMSPWATAARVQREVGLEAILHFTTRDRNLIRLQSDLLAVHALGIRNLLVLRGDPPQAGDYPQATAVSDIHPSGLVRMIKEFNRGRDLAGNSIGDPTEFVVGVALNLGARDLGREVRGLERKLAAGADFVCTMPIFEPETLDKFLRHAGALPVPMLIGVLPLHNARHAEFLHNELPGMVVPDGVREQLREARDGRETGLRVAGELLREIRGRVNGVYMVPSFGRYDRVTALIREVRGAMSAPHVP